MSILLPFALVFFLKFHKVGWKIAASAIICSILVLGVLESNLITYKKRGRTFTVDQIADNLSSILGRGSQKSDTEGTKEWRLIWWANIVRYTIFGPYFWTGKGFGVNLALEDGPPGITAEESALRSPHNGNMTILARMGVPGIVLWIALNFVFVFRLFKAYRVATRSGSQFWSGVNLWIVCYWLAAFTNMSFDVYLEGPQGGIWYWSIIGFGVAALRVQAYEARKSRAESRLRSAELVDARSLSAQT
jgi:O-antigen ligase